MPERTQFNWPKVRRVIYIFNTNEIDDGGQIAKSHYGIALVRAESEKILNQRQVRAAECLRRAWFMCCMNYVRVIHI